MTDAEKRIAAQHDYELGMKYKDIATKYGVSINTVRSWKTRYKWQRNKSKKDVHINQNDVHTKRPTSEAIEQLNESNLTDKRKAFVLEYLRLFNAAQAYINVYEVDYQTAKTNGPRLLRNAHVQKQIKQIREAKLKELAIEPLDLIEDVAKEAKADIGNYLNFGSWPEKLVEKEKTKKTFKDDKGHELSTNVVEDKPVIDADGKQVTIHHSYLYFKDKDQVDTSLIKKITRGKDGATIELYDKTKARDQLLEWLKEQNNDNDTTVNINFDVPKEDNNASKS
ncbi:Terminase small subunit [Lactobacillus kullabergensis]|uniref:Terminase small subunit n=1 Tax=Lactobacillus kullabergensis TaxID=1218493 RepID=A0A0F4LF09_9LACO|nr:terminase small subunit [Lactobacillus kullabergensis]KJY56136.1 Terminase small subunit [Lactobacillus kullabergensis]